MTNQLKPQDSEPLLPAQAASSGLSGKRYVAYGASLMGLKYAIDCAFSNLVFHRAWYFHEYFVPGALNDPQLLAGPDARFYLSMLAIALPFAYIGAALTLRRLRTMGLPPWLVIIFFIPVLNAIFFTILTVVDSGPTGAGNSDSGKMGEKPSTLEDKQKLERQKQQLPALSESQNQSQNQSEQLKSLRTTKSTALVGTNSSAQKVGIILDKMPSDGAKAFFASALLPLPVAALGALLSASILGNYGWSMFAGIPFIASICAPILYGWHKRRRFLECLAVSVVCLFGLACLLLLIPFEGIICLMMAAPIAIGVGIAGGAVGYLIQANLPRSESVPKMLSCFAFLLPLLIVGEYVNPAETPLYKNVSTIEINAPPATVWKYLIEFPPLPKPQELVFQTGIAYPIRAEIAGHGPGAVRHCIFTTGEFVEPITVWDEPHILQFNVRAQPAPMHEMSPYPNLHPPHLDDYLVARQGQFQLTQLDSERTKLDGTTWYQNYMGPAPYWRIWSDSIIHAIHMRVLTHIKKLAEAEVTHKTPN